MSYFCSTDQLPYKQKGSQKPFQPYFLQDRQQRVKERVKHLKPDDLALILSSYLITVSKLYSIFFKKKSSVTFSNEVPLDLKQ